TSTKPSRISLSSSTMSTLGAGLGSAMAAILRRIAPPETGQGVPVRHLHCGNVSALTHGGKGASAWSLPLSPIRGARGMLTMKFALAFAVAALGATGVAAYAHDADYVFMRHGGPAFDMDANHDGWLTRAEASAGADRTFADLDTNHDGRLTDADR